MEEAAGEATHTAEEEDTSTAAAADTSTEEAAGAATLCGTACRPDTGLPTDTWFCARTTTSERARTLPTTAKCLQGKWLNTSAAHGKQTAKFAKIRTRPLTTNRVILLPLNMAIPCYFDMAFNNGSLLRKKIDSLDIFNQCIVSCERVFFPMQTHLSSLEM
jgi:hypothetical protein